MHKILFSLFLIFFGLTFGYTIQIMVNAGKIKLPLPLDELRKGIQKTVLLSIVPTTVLGAIWILDLSDLRIIALPFVGALHFITGGAIAIAGAKIMGLSRKETGSLFSCGFFTNIGSMGGLVAYVLLGESGFALVPVYKIIGEVIYYAVGFPVAKYFSSSTVKDETLLQIIKRVSRDIFVRVSLIAISTGAVLNLLGVPRPDFYKNINALFIPMSAFLMLTAIGMAMHFGSVRKYKREYALIACIKFVLMPFILGSLALLLGFDELMNGLVLKVVVILSFMPVAFTALVPPSIYDLDLDLANACWLVTTSGLALIIPFLSVTMRLMG